VNTWDEVMMATFAAWSNCCPATPKYRDLTVILRVSTDCVPAAHRQESTGQGGGPGSKGTVFRRMGVPFNQRGEMADEYPAAMIDAVLKKII
jgi:hypothetical protein